jgi:hypothetical protein
MRSPTLITLFALVAPVLAAQQATTKPVAAAGDLDAELHYPIGYDAYISTNKPAYVALFDLSRSSVTQIYPTFSAQAEYPTGAQRRAINVPYASLFGNSLVGLHPAMLHDDGWPHVLLLVASTAPLRVGSPWMTEVTLNHSLLQQHHINDVETDGGIEALIDMVKPLDPDAEIAYDRLDGYRRGATQYAGASDFNQFHTSWLGYYCTTSWQPGAVFFTMAAPEGDLCSIVTPARQSVMANATPAASRVGTSRAISESRSIRDPAAIQTFMQSFQGTRPSFQGSQFGNGSSAMSAGGFSFAFGHGGSQERGAPTGASGAAVAPTAGVARNSSKP